MRTWAEKPVVRLVSALWRKDYSSLQEAHDKFVADKENIENIKWKTKRNGKGYYKSRKGYKVMLWEINSLKYHGEYPTKREAKEAVERIRNGKATK